MSTAFAPNSQALALEMYALLRDLDPNHIKGEIKATLHDQLAQLRDQLSMLMASAEASSTGPAIEAVSETGVEFGVVLLETPLSVGAPGGLAMQHGTVGDVGDEGVDKARDRVWIGFDVDIDAPLGSDGRGRRTDRCDDLRESVDPDGVDEGIDRRTGGEDDGVCRSAGETTAVVDVGRDRA